MKPEATMRFKPVPLPKTAMDICIEIYKDYSREQIMEFSTSIQMAWKKGKQLSPAGPGKDE